MIVPDNIDSTDSNGEKHVYRHFKSDINSRNYIILHSLFISKHLTRVSGELDFLVLAPGLGIFALEVKHGRVSRDGGIWKFENRHGKVNTSTIGPFRQVSDTMHSLRSHLLELAHGNAKLKAKIDKLLFGWGVMFTGLEEFYDYGPEAESWQLFTRSGFRIPASHYIESLSRGFHTKYSGRSWYKINESRPTIKDCEDIFKLLRGDFSYNYTPLNQILDEENLIDHFTEEQFDTLSFMDYNDRVLIQGGAGTGKTIMATEWFQRNANQGLKVGLICFNKKLGNKLNSELSKIIDFSSTNSYVGNLHSFMMSLTKLVPPEVNQKLFYEIDLPLETMFALEEFSEDEKFDLLIIDESQDLITESYLDVFDSMLKGGINNGKWVLFGDFCNQLIYLSNPSTVLDILASKSAFIKVPPLMTNCRNSKKIVFFNHTTTGCEKQSSPEGMLEGEKVEHYFPIKSKQVEKVVEIIKDLIAEGIPESKITLLSCKSSSNSSMLQLKEIKDWIKNGLTFSTIHAYKGLQNSFVIATEFEELESDYATSLLYVSISRAKLKFYLVLDKGLENSYNQLLSMRISQTS
ncbi:nuclease-related domain-containing DEAD/DEAH box helicase [Flagellimonas sediminis]|uniref:DNA 3'-5' helicase II n=1 Tax=Flagellimonas sediminis TaxID=2696468 RepID=A0A6I5KQC7_9FLAO|nr:DNA/RNA helicase domain-containing protein [Allomuricauda sediminis]NDV43084.1 AAA family ATPase [Allomuricauda sediminis]